MSRKSTRITHSRQRPKDVIDYIQCLTCPTGKGAGKPFRLLPFEKRWIRAVYGPQRDGLRVVQRAILSMGRKNGKSTLIAALVLVHLCGPESIENGECYSAANERDQAGVIFKIASQIVRASPTLRAEVRIIESTKRLVHFKSGSFFTAISAEAGSKFGFNPTFICYDELAQAKKMDLYNALDTAFGGREETLFCIISTQSADPEHLLSKLIDDGTTGVDPTIVAHLYETPAEADIWDPDSWKPSNPALGHFRRLADIKALADKAKRLPSLEASFRNLILNQRVDARSPFIPRAEWTECKAAGPLIEPGESIYLGLDLSATTDLCALVALSAEDGDRVAAWFWKPGDLIAAHETRDRVPYPIWVDSGYIEAPPGRSIDYGFIAQRIAEICVDYDIAGLAYDRWRIENLLREFTAIGLDAWVEGKEEKIAGGLRLVPFGQGFRDMGPALDALEVSILTRSFRQPDNPVLTWCFSNAIAVADPAGNRKLDKSKSRYRIDGAVAAAMAIGLKSREAGPAEPETSVYEERGVLVV